MSRFAHDVDTLLSDKLGATFAIFKTDRHLLDHVSFIKNYLKLEDLTKGSVRQTSRLHHHQQFGFSEPFMDG